MSNYNLISTEPPIAVVKNTYNEEEQYKILNELKFLQPKLVGVKENKPASHNGTLLASKSSIWLDNIYANREISDILKINRKTYDIMHSIDHWFFDNEEIAKEDHTLVSYYESNDYYKPHKDSAYVTALYWTYKSPKSFVGGNLEFPDLDIKIAYENNTMVLFPSWIKHSVTKIGMINKDMEMGGRFAISQFIGILK